MQNPTIKDFFNFIIARQEIWYKKEKLKLPAPWTKDPVLATYKFCNVYRELDACTQHLYKHVYSNTKLSSDDVILNILLYRRFNTRYFYDKILKGIENIPTCKTFNPKKYEKLMDEAKRNGLKLFSDAYIICQRKFHKQYRIRDKHVQQLYIIDSLKKEPFTRHLQSCKTLSEAQEYLRIIVPMTGDFLAQQYLVDITNFELFSTLWNINSFIDVGPGARPAVDMLFADFPDKTYTQCCTRLFKIQNQYLKGSKWQKICLTPQIRISDIQNCLCEFRKYWCFKHGTTGAKRRLYKHKENNNVNRN